MYYNDLNLGVQAFLPLAWLCGPFLSISRLGPRRSCVLEKKINYLFLGVQALLPLAWPCGLFTNLPILPMELTPSKFFLTWTILIPIPHPGFQHRFVGLYFMTFGYARSRSTSRHVDPSNQTFIQSCQSMARTRKRKRTHSQLHVHACRPELASTET